MIHFTCVSCVQLASAIEGATPELLQLARAQGMNTDVRRRIFVAIMGSGVRTYPKQEPQPCHCLTICAPTTLFN